MVTICDLIQFDRSILLFITFACSTTFACCPLLLAVVSSFHMYNRKRKIFRQMCKIQIEKKTKRGKTNYRNVLFHMSVCCLIRIRFFFYLVRGWPRQKTINNDKKNNHNTKMYKEITKQKQKKKRKSNQSFFFGCLAIIIITRTYCQHNNLFHS